MILFECHATRVILDSFHPAAEGVGGKPCTIGGGPVTAGCDMHDVGMMQSGPMASAAGQECHIGTAQIKSRKQEGFEIASVSFIHSHRVILELSLLAIVFLMNDVACEIGESVNCRHGDSGGYC